MKYALQWIVPRRVLYVVVSGNQTLAELRSLIRLEIDTIEAEGESPVHLIVNNSQLGAIQGSRNDSMRALNQILKHPKIGWLVFVHPISTFRQTIARLILRLSRLSWYNANTLAQALNFLNKQDTSLSDLRAVEFDRPLLENDIEAG